MLIRELDKAPSGTRSKTTVPSPTLMCLATLSAKRGMSGWQCFVTQASSPFVVPDRLEGDLFRAALGMDDLPDLQRHAYVHALLEGLC